MFEGFKAERKSISDEVVHYIKDLIYQGRFSAGDKIPGERELALKMSVSRNTIREAYKILAAQGYLTIKHGQGVFVADGEARIKNITSSFFVKHDDVLELFAIRKVLETQAVVWAVRSNFYHHQLTELESILDDSKIAAKSKDYEELSRLDQKFHLFLIRMSENSVLYRIMMNLIDLLSEARTKSIQIPGRAEQSLKEHAQIVEAIKQKAEGLAKESILNHLASVERSLMSNKSPNVAPGT